MDPINDCQRAIDDALALITTIRPAVWSAATPCEAWDVRTLVNHMVSVSVLFVGGLRKATPDAVPDSLDLGDGDAATVYDRAAAMAMQGASMGFSDDQLVEAFRRGASALMAAWRVHGALERTLTLPFGEMPAAIAIQLATADTLLHTWDLAKALGRPFSMDEGLAATTLAMMQGFYDPAQRGPGKAFGHAVPCPETAPIQDRLVTLSGRQP